MKILDLNQNWKLRYDDLKATVCPVGCADWMETALPCDVHMPLLENGIIKEPLEYDNSFECEWTEHKSWWFLKEFDFEESAEEYSCAELTLDGLDAEADIYLNGRFLGHHKSTFFPFVQDVKQNLKLGKNTLLVRLTSGLEYYDETNPKNMKEYVSIDEFENRCDRRRIFVRKPQYVFGWDWNPRIPSCAVESAKLTLHKKAAFRNLAVYAKNIEKNAKIGIEAELQNFDVYGTCDAFLHVEIYDGDILRAQWQEDLMLKSGTHIYDGETLLCNAELWWPNGLGEQMLYRVKAYLICEGEEIPFPEFSFGVRQISLCTDRIDEENREFAVCVNGIKIFCKGGNWIPADSIYSRITREKTETLVAEAKEANFNMLRVWGGGLYERECFYEACDKNGILVWQDLMFACALYPDFLADFADLAEKEINYQSKRLRRHACLALFCGENENHWGAKEW